MFCLFFQVFLFLIKEAFLEQNVFFHYVQKKKFLFKKERFLQKKKDSFKRVVLKKDSFFF